MGIKGIILAGGLGTRLYPLTSVINKQSLPVYDKPLIYYPLSTLISSGIRDILIISTPNDTPIVEKLLGDGNRLGCNFSYAVQEKPNGIASAFIIGKEFIGNNNVALILGDNIFYSSGLHQTIKKHCIKPKDAAIFAYEVAVPNRYGVVEVYNGKAVSVEEKPKYPKSNFVVPGLYFYNNDVVSIAESLKLSSRGEYEISDVNQAYIDRGSLEVHFLERESVWLDAGTFDSLLEAAQLVQAIEKRQGFKFGCIEEAAYLNGFITRDEVRDLGTKYDNDYGNYLLQL